jgi:hypothetical protein
MRRRQRMVGFRQWAALVGLADDDGSLATARALMAQGDGPPVVQIRRRRRADPAIQLSDHQRWVRANKWAKFLAAEAARKQEEIKRSKLGSGLKNTSLVGMR